MNEVSAIVLICRSVKDGVSPGSEPGFACKTCGEPISVTSENLARARAGATLLCNPCGRALLAITGPDRVEAMPPTSEAREQFKRLHGEELDMEKFVRDPINYGLSTKSKP